MNISQLWQVSKSEDQQYDIWIWFIFKTTNDSRYARNSFFIFVIFYHNKNISKVMSAGSIYQIDACLWNGMIKVFPFAIH